MTKKEIKDVCIKLKRQTKLPVFDVIEFGASELTQIIKQLLMSQ